MQTAAIASDTHVTWSVRTRDETFRPFDPVRIKGAILKALTARKGSLDVAESNADREIKSETLTKAVCQTLIARQPDGGVIYLEHIQDQVELELMRAGEHEAGRRYVIYREERRRMRTEASGDLLIDTDLAPLVNKMGDPLLSQTMDRFVMFPIQHKALWDAFKDHLSLMWTAEEIDLSSDVKDWNTLSDPEQHFLKHVLAFFAASDGIVNENLATRFYQECTAPEARAFYSMQMLIETIHSETYSLLIDTYVSDAHEKDDLLHATETMPIVKKKAEWALKWLGSNATFGERLLAFACVEGIFFSSSFCAIYWIKDKKGGLLPGLTFSNELISRDEGLHTDFAILLHHDLQEKVHPDRMHELVAEAVAIEEEFACESLPVALIGMNAGSMRSYIRFVADRLLKQMGTEPLYNEPCPFDFMERIALQNKTNFHEKKVAEYRRAGVGKTAIDQRIAFDEEF